MQAVTFGGGRRWLRMAPSLRLSPAGAFAVAMMSHSAGRREGSDSVVRGAEWARRMDSAIATASTSRRWPGYVIKRMGALRR